MKDHVDRFLRKRMKKTPWSFADAPDPRQQGKVDHGMSHVLNALSLGLLSNEPTLRDVEEMTRELGPWSRTLVPAPISDTTLDTEARRLSEPYLAGKLVGQVRDMKRSKMMAPFGLPSWLVRQETKLKDGTIVDVEDRFFISSVLWNYLKPAQILILVRNHWGIENDAFNSLDLQWHEDHGPWCTQGNAVWTLGLLRLMAYNLVQYLRKRSLRRTDEHGRWREPLSWRRVFRKVRRALAGATIEAMATTTGG